MPRGRITEDDDDDVYGFPDLPTVQDPLARVWRYLIPIKFFALLKQRSLFLPNTELFTDPREGSFPDANRIVRDGLWERLEVSKEQRQIIEDSSRWNKHLTFVSCWHLSNHESAALWEIYAKAEKAVVVQSTFGRLRKCLPDYVHIHPVTYLDYRRNRIPDGHSLYPFFFKSREYSHEKELRAVTGDLPMSDRRRLQVEITDTGWSFPIDPNQLIETVYVAPGSSEAAYDAVRTESARLGLAAPILPSAMDVKPRF